MPCENCINGNCQGQCHGRDPSDPRAKKEQFPFKGTPMAHQVRALRKAWPKKEFALFHAMGSGKTYTAINLACARHLHEQIERVLIVCPTPIKSVWQVEFEKWSPIETDIFVFNSGDDKAYDKWLAQDSDKLRVLVVGIEALSQGKAYDRAIDFVHKQDVMMIVDESSRIKTPGATRTKRVSTLGGAALYRLIMTGTPITQGMQDLYSQIQFLNSNILKCKSYFLFKNLYCVMGGFENRKIIGYQNKEVLLEHIKPYVDVVTKKEALPDLPPKVFQKVTVDITKEQKAAIKQLEQDMAAEQGDKELTVSTVMDRLTRYQQIIGGHFPHDDQENGGYGIEAINGKNPKMEAVKGICDIIDEKAQVIIWARFRPELELIAEVLRAEYGDSSVLEFHGGVSEDERTENTESFQAGRARFMVSNPTVGGMGQTWTAATYVIYYSNTFSYEDRMQSEDRAHRKGQDNKVTYIDIEADHKADKMILKAIKSKDDVAKYVESNLEESKL